MTRLDAFKNIAMLSPSLVAPAPSQAALRHDAASNPGAHMPTIGDEVVVAKDLRKHFGALHAVDGIDLSIPPGTCFGLLGPNGAGKTTTIKMIHCVSPVTGGSLHVLGLDVNVHPRRIKQRIGVVPQENNLDPDFSVRKNLETYARYFGIAREPARKRARELLEFSRLSEKADAHVETLSGGMKRRLVVARALVNDPELLVLDEPTTGLDPQARHVIWEQIRDLRRRGKTILLTTHYMDEAERLCDWIVVIDQGKVLEQGTPQALILDQTGGEALEIVPAAHAQAPAPARTGGTRRNTKTKTATPGTSIAQAPTRPEELKPLLASIGTTLDAARIAYEVLPDRIIAFGPDARAIEKRISKKHQLAEALIRRATLEDVFLRLTGRALRD